MKIFLLLLLLVARGPLLCEENSLLGYRLDWNNSKGNVSFKIFRTLEKKKEFSGTGYSSDSHQGAWFSKFTPARNLFFFPRDIVVLELNNRIVGFLTWWK